MDEKGVKQNTDNGENGGKFQHNSHRVRGAGYHKAGKQDFFYIGLDSKPENIKRKGKNGNGFDG